MDLMELCLRELEAEESRLFTNKGRVLELEEMIARDVAEMIDRAREDACAQEESG